MHGFTNRCLHGGMNERVQEKCGLPWVIGLDLTSTDTDMLNLAPALVVKRLDPPEDTQDPADPQALPPSFYLCLLSDNR